jgi:hypothetical protein
MRLFVCVLLAVAGCAAQGLETWQTAEAALISTERSTVVLHTQVRQRQHFTDLFQARIGPVFRVSLRPRVALVGGYYFGEVEQTQRVWGNTHRTFAGFQSPVAFAGGVLTGRTLVEHHFGGGTGPSVRFREMVQWTRPVRRFAAFSGTETFFDQRGFIWQRMQAGLRLPFRASYRLELSYLYDARVERIGAGRHVIQTALRPTRRER